MKRIKKHIIFILLLGISFISVISCSKNTKTEKALFKFNESYEVGIRIESFETSGRLFLEEDAIRFLHTAENSSLFGLEEVFIDKHYTANFHDMSWETSDSFPATHIIYRVFDIITEDDVQVQNTEYTTMKGREAIQYSFSDDEGSFELYIDKDTEKPIKVAGTQQNLNFEINFML